MERKSVRASIVHKLVNDHASNSGVPAKMLNSIRLNGVSFRDLDVIGADAWTYDNEFVHLRWNTPFAPAEQRIVRLEYTVVSPLGGLYFNVPDENYPDRPLHAITDHEPERARYWLACTDHSAVRSLLTFSLRAPSHMEAIANGAPTGQHEHNDGSRTSSWALDIVCPSYLICVAVGLFEVVTVEPVNGVPVSYYAPLGAAHRDMHALFDTTPAMMRFLPKLLDMEFPWPTYRQVCSPFVGGAMENMTLVTWDIKGLMDDNYAKDTQIRMAHDLTNVHEMAHTYFGDLVTIRSYADIWLKESWATYCEAAWLEKTASKEALHSELLYWADSYISETEDYMHPIVTNKFEVPVALFDSHTYPGGAWRLHMLRQLLGEDAFWRGVRTYLKVYRTRIVETDQFRRCLEDASGLNLTRFFDQWIFSNGFPAFKGDYTFCAEKRQVEITCEQTQVDPSQSIPLFDCILTVEIIDSDGKAHRQNMDFSSEGNHARSSVVIPLGNALPCVIRVDPDCTLLFTMDMNPGEGVLGNTAKSAEGVIPRVWAYRELIKIGGASALQKVHEAVVAEPFYEVRMRVAEALGEAKTPGSRAILIAMLKKETNASVVHDIVVALSVRDKDNRAALLGFLQGKDLPYRAHAAALESLAAQCDPADDNFLLEAAQDSSKIGQHAIVRSGALRALGQSRSPKAFAFLLDALTLGKQPELARSAVVKGIRISAPWQEAHGITKATSTLVSHLKDPALDVRLACIAALTDPAIAAWNAIPTILSTRCMYDHIEWPAVYQMISKLRSGVADGPNAGSAQLLALAKSVEVLEDKIRSREQKDEDREEEEEQQLQKAVKDSQVQDGFGVPTLEGPVRSEREGWVLV
ncbi:hypothetical protein HKX48_000955 [Thoreauomyces humboldtii]|nr:hypothetical protein HKX48_000955 [Thoreauomyces humboldtii]